MSLGFEVTPEAGLREAWRAATASPDRSTQNGAVLFGWDGRRITAACNTISAGVLHAPERFERPLKYDVTEHAERATIYAAARTGWPTDGATMYCGWAACADCARAIIHAGIIRLVRDGRATYAAEKAASGKAQKAWVDSVAVGDQMLAEAGVEIINYSPPGPPGALLGGLKLRLSGEEWQP